MTAKKTLETPINNKLRVPLIYKAVGNTYINLVYTSYVFVRAVLPDVYAFRLSIFSNNGSVSDLLRLFVFCIISDLFFLSPFCSYFLVLLVRVVVLSRTRYVAFHLLDPYEHAMIFCFGPFFVPQSVTTELVSL